MLRKLKAKPAELLEQLGNGLTTAIASTLPAGGQERTDRTCVGPRDEPSSSTRLVPLSRRVTKSTPRAQEVANEACCLSCKSVSKQPPVHGFERVAANTHFEIGICPGRLTAVAAQM